MSHGNNTSQKSFSFNRVRQDRCLVIVVLVPDDMGPMDYGGRLTHKRGIEGDTEPSWETIHF